MRMSADYYRGVLGVYPDAAQDEIKAAYRELARELHPDVNGDSRAQERYSLITEAYAVLSSPERRERYDRGETIAEFPPGTRVCLRVNRGVTGAVVTRDDLTTEDTGLGFTLPSSDDVIVRWDDAYPAISVNPAIEHAGPDSEEPEEPDTWMAQR